MDKGSTLIEFEGFMDTEYLLKATDKQLKHSAKVMTDTLYEILKEKREELLAESKE